MENYRADECEICGDLYIVGKPHICRKENSYVQKLNLPRALAREISLKNTIKLINDLERKIKELTEEVADWKAIAEGYQKQFEDCAEDRSRLTEENERLRAEKEVLEITEKDLRFRNKELQRCNEGLAKNIEELEIEGDKVREAYAKYEETTGLKQVRADTVREMQERLDKHFCHDPAFLGVEQRLIMDVIAQIAKELIGDE